MLKELMSELDSDKRSRVDQILAEHKSKVDAGNWEKENRRKGAKESDSDSSDPEIEKRSEDNKEQNDSDNKVDDQ